MIKMIEKFSFGKNKMLDLNVIDISFNLLTFLNRYMFIGLQKVNHFYAFGNELYKLPHEIFGDIYIKRIFTDNYKICCMKPSPSTMCKAFPVWPNSCKRLIDDKMVRGCMWFVGVSGLLLNLVSCLINRFKRKYISGNMSYKVMVFSLAVGDVLICASLLIVVSADQIIGENYLQFERMWRGHVVCCAAGGLSIASNMISVFSIHLITITRYYITKYPLKAISIRKRRVLMSVSSSDIILTIIGFGLVNIHISRSESGLMPNGLCLLIGGIDKSIIPSVVTVFTIMSQAIPVIVIPICYLFIVIEMKRQTPELKGMAAKKQRKNTEVSKTATVSLSNILCWLPSSVLLILTLSWEKYPLKIFLWTTAIVLPLNALINPMVFVYFKLLTNAIKQISVKITCP